MLAGAVGASLGNSLAKPATLAAEAPRSCSSGGAAREWIVPGGVVSRAGPEHE